MNHHDDRDQQIRDLFQAAKRADRGDAPQFEVALDASPARTRFARRGWNLTFATTAATLAVAFVALWLGRQQPLPAHFGDPAPASAPASAPLRVPVPAPPPPPPPLPPRVPAVAKPLAPPPAETAAPRPTEAHGSGAASVIVTDADELQVKADETTAVKIQLFHEIAETVKVTAEREVIALERTQHSTTFSADFIQDLPVPGRFHQDVLTLTPGVQDADGDGNPNVHGSRERDFQAIVGGVKGVDPLTGAFLGRINPSAIEEMETITRGGLANTESYRPIVENGVLAVRDNPLSTFSIDVDTASYANVRRFLTHGTLPPRDAVRTEELLNYFSYDDPPPSGGKPFSARIEIAGCPWNAAHRLARIGLKGRTVARGESRGSNLVFLIDVSGSMDEPAKLPLLKRGLALLVDQLAGRDQVSIVVYAGASGLVLPPTPGSAKAEIKAALERLSAGGSTNGASGLKLAYQTAREHYIRGGVNRVILATDGDFNVGVTSQGQLLGLIEEHARAGVALTTLGFGTDNYKDDMLEHLADRGNGNYAYIDSLQEARKVLVEQVEGTLVTIAKDVKIQVEFNPARVAAYRLIGYENRALSKEDFNDDRKDAGEIGAGHGVTALYELVPAGSEEVGGTPEAPAPALDPLKYQTPSALAAAAKSPEVLTLKLRYKAPDGEASRLLSFSAVDSGDTLAAASADLKFSAAVAAFGMILRGSPHVGTFGLEQVRSLAHEGLGADAGGYRAGLLELVDRAAALRRTGAPEVSMP